ncbi:hypothetical protein HY480_01390 [Candidatus Uhrbacteria bacterium]|nr:hypothetical protein [Candidatus Uhrbacteria bacterium]
MAPRTTLDLFVTLMPSFPHFARFARDARLAGIRLNSAMTEVVELDDELARIRAAGATTPLWFDVKGRQMRVVEVGGDQTHLVCVLNHAITVRTPIPVLFKGGEDSALLDHLEDGGRRLVFRGGPAFTVRAGESIHIRHPSLVIHGPLFTRAEREKIAKVRAAGFHQYFLSYVEEQRDIDELRELVGADAELMLKIESTRGLDFVARQFRKRDGVTLVAARGDLFVEVDKPHAVLPALRLIIAHDPEAIVGSRILLSVAQEPLPAELRGALQHIVAQRPPDDAVTEILMGVLHRPVPSCADCSDLAWLTDIGYRRMLLCDELCLKGELLGTAVNIVDAFRKEYGAFATTSAPERAAPAVKPSRSLTDIIFSYLRQ